MFFWSNKNTTVGIWLLYYSLDMNRLEKKLVKIGSDPKVTAKAVGLRYIDDQTDGYKRIKKGNEFIYVDATGKKITYPNLLKRFKELVIPPAYENVWISPSENTHLQFTGVDVKGRKQYRYHKDWNKIRNQAKFYRLRRFAEALPLIRKQVEKDLKIKDLTFGKVLALIVKLMELTNIRIGNDTYSKLYGSFGLTTLKDKHVKFEGNTISFSFKGKKGIYHDIKLQSRTLRNLVKRCQDIPGKELFQYYDRDGKHYKVDSGDVNNYLKQITGEDFTAKDFRTWAGSVHALCFLKEIGTFDKESDCKKNILQAIDHVAKRLGNTRTVCKKYYVHPTVLSAYENGRINIYKTNKTSANILTAEERLLIKILEQEKIAEVIC